MAGRIAYLGNIVTQGLVLDLDAAIQGSYPKTGSLWTDISGNNNNGTLTNGPAYTGSDYGAIVFDGVDDYAVISSSAILAPRTGEFTVDSWVNPGNTGSFSPLFVANSTNGLFFGWGATGGGNNFVIRAYNVANRLQYNTLPLKNQWTNIVGNRVGTTLNLYYNGTPVAVSSSNQDFIQSDVYIGSDGYPGAPVLYTGQIAVTKYYNTGLSQFQVWQNFNAYKSRYGIPDIVTDGLVLNLDAGNPYSYLSGSSGTTWSNTVAVSSSISGTLVNGPVYSNGAITFDGVDDYVNLPHIFDISSGGVTWNIWFKASSTAWSPLFSDWYTNQWSFNIQVYLGNVTVNIRNASGADIGPTSLGLYSVSANTTYNLCCTYDKTTKNTILYINGTLINSYPNSLSDPAIRNTTNNWSIGYKQDSGNSLSGNVYTAQIYNRALTQAEITQNFNALRGRYGI